MRQRRVVAGILLILILRWRLLPIPKISRIKCRLPCSSIVDPKSRTFEERCAGRCAGEVGRIKGGRVLNWVVALGEP